MFENPYYYGGYFPNADGGYSATPQVGPAAPGTYSPAPASSGSGNGWMNILNTGVANLGGILQGIDRLTEDNSNQPIVYNMAGSGSGLTGNNTGTTGSNRMWVIIGVAALAIVGLLVFLKK